MKVVHINTERGWRGGERQSYLLVRELAKRGVENWIVARPGEPWGKRCVEAGAQAFWVRPLGEWDPFAAHRLNRFLKKIQPDVLHAHTGHAAGLGAFASLGLPVPLIVHRRVDFHLSSNPFSRWKTARARKFIAISQGVKSVLLEDGVPEGKIELIPSGVDFDPLESGPSLDLTDWGIFPGAKVVGQIAALADHKDQATLVRAAGILKEREPDLQFIIFGEGKERRRLEGLIKQEGVERTFHLAGFVDRPERYLKSFSIFCLSSKLEGLGTALLDAMASRVLVVAARAGGIPDLIESGQTGFLVPPQNPTALAGQLSTALRLSPGDKSQILGQAHKKAMEFEISKIVDKIEAFYQSLK